MERKTNKELTDPLRISLLDGGWRSYSLVRRGPQPLGGDEIRFVFGRLKRMEPVAQPAEELWVCLLLGKRSTLP